MASADAVSPTPATSAAAQQQLRTVVLRVSIHCLGCKKKVRKVLRSIEGVKDVKVDAAMHKVTVTGTVDGDTLVKRLYKSGKQAVPWQHPHVAPAPEAVKAIEAAPQQPEAAPAGDDDGGKGSDAAAAAAKEAAAQAESSEEKKTEEKPEAEKEAEKKEEEQEAKPSDEAKKDAGGESEAAPEAKAKGDDVGAEPAKEAVPAAAVKEASNDDEGAKDEKSKPKDAGDAAPPAAATTTERSLHFSPTPAAHKQHEEHYPYPYYGAPQPVMSYHMAQPTTSVSYYAPRPEPAYSMQQHPPPPAYSAPPPQQQQYPPPSPSPQPQAMQQQWSPSHLYMPYPHSSPDTYYRDYYSPPGTAHAPPLQDEYRMFDDENPTACSVM